MKSFRDYLFACATTARATSTARCVRRLRTNGEGGTFVKRISLWTAPAFVVILAGLLSGGAMAQPILVIDDASVFEGNTGTTILVFPLRFVGAQPNMVTGVVSAIPLTGTGFNPATGAAVCGGAGVDFEQFSVPFTIPPNTPNGTLSINIRVCSDTAIEPNEHIFVSLTNVVGAQCLEGTCNAVGTILNDDGLPSMSINNISTSEPLFAGTSKTAAFTVTLSHPSTQTTTVHFATRDGTAKIACLPPCFGFADYVATSGTLTIPPSNPPNVRSSGIINVTILGDGITENDETFFVDLSSPVNATIADGVGQATIRDTTLSIGGFDLSPDNAVVQVDETVIYTLDWTVPVGEVWTNLKSIDFRVRDGHKIALWIRWDQAGNTFSLCRKGGKSGDDDTDDDDARAGQGPGADAVCGPGQIPGSSGLLVTPFARVDLFNSSVVGSGPGGRVVTLELALSFLKKAAGHSYIVELAAADDFGNVDRFVRASELRVEKSRRH